MIQTLSNFALNTIKTDFDSKLALSTQSKTLVHGFFLIRAYQISSMKFYGAVSSSKAELLPCEDIEV